MATNYQPLLDIAFLRAHFFKDFEEYQASQQDGMLLARLKNWAAKDWQKETASESTFIDLFFRQTWGYKASGEADKIDGYTLQQQFPVRGAGQKGGTGAADIAMGYFGRKDTETIPQVLGEFKDDRSGLDKPQANRPNDRSPVDQCLDYLREARTGLISSVLPTWALVTDMNEFRLYMYGSKNQFQRFIIQSAGNESLLGAGEEAAFQRFLFQRIFQAPRHLVWI